MTLIAWQATVQDDEGNVIVNPSITVRRASDDGLADIFDSEGEALDNPYTGTSEGFVQFFAQPGKYTVQGARGGSVTQTWTIDLSSPTGKQYPSRSDFVDDVASGYAPAIGTVVTAGGVQYVREAGADAITDLLGWLPFGVTTPQHFGANGDGVADDTLAIQDAIASGAPLEWGRYVYRFTDTIDVDLGADSVMWSGTPQVIFDPSSARRFGIRIQTSGDVLVEGRFHFDGQNLCYIGIEIENPATRKADFRWNNLFVENVKRSGTDFAGGDAILVRGSYDRVTFDCPKIRNITMAVGAGTPKVQGIAGINIRSSGNDLTRMPIQVSVINPDIDVVESDDPDYTMDQDGIKVRIPILNSTDEAPTRVDVSGGVISNCRGRAIKVQAEFGVVRGTKFVRNRPHTSGLGNAEIDFQDGNGQVSSVEAEYDGSCPSRFVQLSYTGQTGRPVAHGSVDGVNIRIRGSVALPSVIENNTRSQNRGIVKGSRISVIGALDKVVRFNSVGEWDLLLDQIDAAPSLAFVQTGSTSGSGTVKASKCINTGSSEIKFYDRVSSSFTARVSTDDCVGFLKRRVLSGENAGFKRIGLLAPDDGVEGGTTRMVNFRLENDEIFVFPEHGYLGRTWLGLVSVGFSRSSNCVIGTDNTQVAIVSQPSNFFTAGGSEPDTGDFRFFTSDGTPAIANRSGSARSFTCLLIG